ncbi:hypothetical protein SCP_0603230 [Sparassis crispa]|uniref:Uncharacterized protein n=1 Tax=Sparassis crispa TaxID=139825 RepID=A0A401GQ31_9APHY|nr:hypothetical protein SCP_0603230 [Sparassis crispa]GBE84345.1 hypothetical protein SCP_0603230 [Sparassis crispa]
MVMAEFDESLEDTSLEVEKIIKANFESLIIQSTDISFPFAKGTMYLDNPKTVSWPTVPSSAELGRTLHPTPIGASHLSHSLGNKDGSSNGSLSVAETTSCTAKPRPKSTIKY